MWLSYEDFIRRYLFWALFSNKIWNIFLTEVLLLSYLYNSLFKEAMILVCLKAFSFTFSTLPIKSLGIMFILLPPSTWMQLFTPSRLSRASDMLPQCYLSFVWLVCFATWSIDWWCNIVRVNDFTIASFMRFLSLIYILSINSWFWRYSLKVKVYILINCSFIRNSHKQFSVNLFNNNWGISNVKKQCLMFSGITLFLKPCNRFQYVYFLNYLRSCFPFIDLTNYVKNKQFSVFMLKVPDYTGLSRGCNDDVVFLGRNTNLMFFKPACASLGWHVALFQNKIIFLFPWLILLCNLYKILSIISEFTQAFLFKNLYTDIGLDASLRNLKQRGSFDLQMTVGSKKKKNHQKQL